MISVELKNKVAEFRKEKNISQSELAEQVGISRNAISSIERGEYEPTAYHALKICMVLGKMFEEVFFFDFPNSMVIDKELKSCPFCNGKAKIRRFGKGCRTKEEYSVNVQCTNCGARTEPLHSMPHFSYAARVNLAIEHWERRVIK